MLMARPMYAYEISTILNQKFGFSTAKVTVYVVLYKMRREGLIKIKEEKSVLGRPNRKYYSITKKGKLEFLKGRNFLQDMLNKLL